jgi:uncharacterized membrane protein (DUF2068 family)
MDDQQPDIDAVTNVILLSTVFVLPSRLKKGIRAIAVFEAAKGMLVLLAGLAIFSLFHKNVQLVAEQLLEQGHFNPAKQYPRIFIDAATNLTDSRIRMLAILALLYSSVRFVEAYGLWFEKRWAEWFALLSGGVYLPIELYELAKGFTWLKISLVVINLIIVLYLALLLKRNGQRQEG